MALGTLLVSLHDWTAHSKPALSGEMLYVWLGLYSAYFFTPRTAAAQLALISAAYLGVLLGTVRLEAVPAAWFTLVGILFPAAGLLRAVRDGVTRLVDDLSEAAMTDTLTGLRNRLALDQELHAEVERAAADTPLSLVIGDLDYFKSVNDRLGHKAGDEALVRAGRVLLRTAAPATRSRAPAARSSRSCCPARPSTRPTSSRSACAPPSSASSPRTRPPDLLLRDRDLSDHGRSADAVLEAADQALYAAKALGRNRCVIFNPEISAIFAPQPAAGPTRSSSRRWSRSPRRSTCATPARPTTRGRSAATAR